MADPTPGSGLNSLDSSPFIITPSIFGRALSSAENSRGNSRSNSDEKLEEIQIDIINPHQEEEHGKTQTIQATHSPPAPQTTPVPPAEKKLSPMTVHLSLSPISQAHTTELVDDEFLSDPACSSEDAASTTDLPTDFRLPMTKHTHRDHSKYPLMSRENPRIQSSVRQMIESCRKQKGFTRLAIYAVTCLKNHAIDEASAEDLIREGVLDFLLEVLSDHPDHEGLVSIINECIGSLNRSERLASLITERLKHESSLPFLSPLRGFQKPQSIITACKTISHLFSNSQSSQNNNYVNVLVNAGLYTTMSGVAKTFHTNQKVIESISSILRQSIVVSGDESARSAHQLIETGMVAKIIQSFSHISDHAAAIEPLRLLENIATVDKVSLKYLKTLGTMDASIAVLNRFQSNRDIAKAGADLLSVLSTNKDVQSILDCPSAAVIFNPSSLSKLASLLLVPENVEYFVAQKGIPWLVEAITAIDEAHDSPSPLLISSILAISRIACVKTHTVELMNNGCVGMLVAQLEKHAQSEPIVNAALEALAEIGNHEAGAEGIMEQKGIDIAIAAFKVHSSSRECASQILSLIESVSLHYKCAQKMVDASLYETLLFIADAYADDPQIAFSLSSIMDNLCATPESSAALVQWGGLQIPLGIMEKQAHDVDFCGVQLDILHQRIASSDKAVEELRRLNALQPLSQVYERHTDNETLRASAMYIMNTLTDDTHSVATVVKSIRILTSQLGDPRCMANEFKVNQAIVSLSAAAETLKCLSVVDVNCDEILAADGIEALIYAYMTEPLRQMTDDDYRKVSIRTSIMVIAERCSVRLCSRSNDESAGAEQSPQALSGALKSVPVSDLFHVASSSHLSQPDTQLLSSALRSFGNLMKVSPQITAVHASAILNTVDPEVLTACLMANVDQPQGVILPLQEIIRLVMEKGTPISHAKVVSYVNTLLTCINKHIMERGVVLDAVNALVSCTRQSSEAMRALAQSPQFSSTMHAILSRYEEDATVCTPTLSLLNDALKIDPDLAGGLSAHLLNTLHNILQTHTEAPEVLRAAQSVMDMIKSELETEASPSSPSNHTVASASVQSAPPPTSPHAGVPSEVGILQSQLSVYRNDKSLHDLSLSPQLPSDREAPLSFTAMDIEAHVNNLNTISSDSLHNFYTLLTQEPEDPEYAVLAIEHGAAKKLTAFIETHIDPCDELFWDAMKALIALIERMDIRIIEAMIEGCETTQPELIRMLSVLFELDAARIIAPFRELYKRLVRDCVRLLSILVGMYPKVMLALQRQRIVPALMFLLQRVDDKRTSLYGRNIMHLLYQLTASPFVDATIKRTVLQAYETYDIPTFFRLIRGHTHDGRFVRYAAGFIANMAMIHPRIRNDLGVSGSIILLLDLLSQYQHDAFITDTVVHALVVMTEDHPVHTAFIIAAQREQTLLSCLHQYIGNKKIAHGILCVVLSVMNTNSPNLDALVENQGLASLLQCMWHHSSSEEFSLTCLDLIKSLLTRQYKKDRKSSTIEQQQLKTLYRTIKSEMIYRGFGRGIVASVTEHVSSSPVAYQALQAMVCLIKEADEEEFAILISEGAVFMLYSVIRHHLSADALNSTLAASAMNALLIALKYHTVATQAAVMKQVPFREMNTLVVTYVMDALRRAMAGVQEAEREKAVQDKARERLRVAAIVKVREEHREKERKEKEQRRQLLEREARTPAATAAKTAATTTTPIVKATEQQHSEGTESNDTSAAVSGEEEGTGVHIDLESHTTSLSISLSRLSSSSSSSSSSETYYQTMSVSRSSSVYSRRSSIEPSTSDADTPQATSSLQRQGRTPEEEKKIEKEVAEKPDVIVPELSTLYNSLIVRVWLRFLCIIARNTSNTEHLLNEDVENQVLMTLQKHYLAGASRIAEECLELLEILSDHSHDSPSHLMIKSSLLCIHLYSTTKYLNPSMLGQLNSALASLCRDRRSAHLMALTVMLSNAFLLVAYEDDDCVCVPSLQLLANLFNFKFPTLSLQYTPVVANLFQYLCNRAKHVNSSSSDNSSNSNSYSSYSSYSNSSSSRDGLTPVVFGLRVIQNLLLANGSMMKPYLETQHSLHKHLSTIENGFLISPPSHLQQVRRLIASIKEICKQIARTKRISSSNTDRSSTMPRANASTRLFRRDDSSTSADMPSDVRNLLLAGAELWKHSSHVSKRLRHVRITPDLRYLVWKDRKVKAHAHSVTMKQKMKVFQIKAVEVGRKTEPLLRRSSLTRKHSARRDCAFAVVGEERTLSLEAHSTQEREQWVHALNTLVRHVQARRKAAKSPLLTKRHYTVE